MADLQIENIAPSASDATDRLLVRRGAGPLDHTMELVQVDDALHGSRAGGALHADATTSAAGFMSAADKLKLNALSAITLQEEGVNVTTALSSLNVVGLGGRASGTSAATLTINGLVTAAPSGNQADWSPAGFDAATGTIKAQPTVNSFITGLAAGATDQTVTICNDSNFVICFEKESATSAAANRFNFRAYGSLWLLPQEAVTFRYCGTAGRWRLLSQSRDVFAVGPRMSLYLPSNGANVQAMGLSGVATTATISNTNSAGSPGNEFVEYSWFQGTNSTVSGTTSARASQLHFLRGNTADRQGFFHAGMVRFTAMGATGAVRAGMTNSGGNLTTLNAALTQCLLLGADGTHTTLRIFFGDAAAGTPIDLGANFPVPNATAAYEYCFLAQPNTSAVRYMVRRLDSRFVTEGTLTANIPTNTTALGHRIEAMVGGTGAANTWQAAYLLTAGL